MPSKAQFRSTENKDGALLVHCIYSFLVCEAAAEGLPSSPCAL